jgi:hypothetical protein
MKTIEITDEMYNSLMELSKEMTTQDMLCTAMPHMFQIRTIEQVPAMEGCGTEAWHSDGTVIHEWEDIKYAVFEWKEWDIKDKEDLDKFEELSSSEIDEVLEENWSKIQFSEEEKFQNTFLTAKACKEHIEANNYRYSSPTCYLNHSFRNPEMELVSKFLCELSGGKIHK